VLPRQLAQPADQRLVAAMQSVEIADRNHAAAMAGRQVVQAADQLHGRGGDGFKKGSNYKTLCARAGRKCRGRSPHSPSTAKYTAPPARTTQAIRTTLAHLS